MIEINSEVLRQLDEAFLAGATKDRIAVRDPRVSGVVRRGGSNRAVSLVIQVAGEHYGLSGRALEQLLGLCRARIADLEELPDNLITATLNFKLGKRWSWFTHALTAEGEIRTFVNPGWREVQVRPSEVLRACAEGIRQNGGPVFLEQIPEAEDWPVHCYTLTQPELRHTFAESPRENDTHQFWVRLHIDYTGWSAPVFYAVGLRLVCRNGLMLPADLPASEKRIWAANREALLEGLRQGAASTARWVRTQLVLKTADSIRTSLLGAPLAVVWRCLPRPVAELVETAYRMEDLGGTTYHLVNAITRAARDEQCPRDWQERLMVLAAELTIGRRCPNCLQRLSSQ